MGDKKKKYDSRQKGMTLLLLYMSLLFLCLLCIILLNSPQKDLKIRYFLVHDRNEVKGNKV